MKKLNSFLLGLVLSGVVTHAYAQEDLSTLLPDLPAAPEINRVTSVVEFKAEPSARDLAAWQAKGISLERVSPYKNDYFNRTYRAKINFAQQTQLSRHPSVKKVEESLPVNLQSVEDEPLFNDQWYLQNTGYDVREDITDIRSTLRPGQVEFDVGFKKLTIQLETAIQQEVIVAVLDTGVDIEHEDLAANIAVNTVECDNGKIPLGEAKEDKDNNGYKGDCMGINLTANPTTEAAQRNRPFEDTDRNAKQAGHGTHVSGIISAVSGNGKGLSGLSNHIKILPVKLISKDELRHRVPLTDRVAEGILYAVSRGAKVINMSVGWPIGWNTDHVYEAIREARRRGVYIVAAAGNNSHSVPTYPCSYADVICVGATQNDGAVAAFSNYGAQVDVLAPGDRILSTFPMTRVPEYYAVNGYEMKNGTSQASPVVASILAALVGVYPNASYEENLARLLTHTQNVRTHDKYFSQGQARLDLALANVTAPEYLRFVFKEKAILTVSQQREFNLSFVVQNLSAVQQEARIAIASQTEGASFRQPQKLVQISPWSSATVEFTGSLDSFEHERQIRFSVNINGSEKLAQSILAQEFDHISRLQKWPIENSKDLNNLVSISDVDGLNAGQYYGSFKRVEAGIELILWERLATELKERGRAVLPDLQTPWGLFTGDANGDNVKDIILLGLKANATNRTVVFYYLNSQLQPLWPTHPSFVMNDETPVFQITDLADYRMVRWFKMPAPGLNSTLLVPSIMHDGYKPELDKSRDERRNPGVMENHVYYVEPYAKDDNSLGLRWRIVDSYKWTKAIRDALGLYYYETIQPMSELSNGHYLFLAGQLSSARTLEVKLGPDFTWRDLNWPQNLMGYKYIRTESYDVTADGKRRDLEAMFGIITLSRAHLVFVDAQDRSRIVEQYTLDLPDESERVLKALVISRTPTQVKTIIESGQKLFGFFGPPKTQLQSTEVEFSRSTFFGQKFEQVNLPIQMQSGESALYVDDTQMTSNNIYVQQMTAKNGFFAPLATSYTLSENCRRLNPARWSGERSYRVNVLCRLGANNEQMEIRSLLIEAK